MKSNVNPATQTSYPNALQLNPYHRQLEGFTSTGSAQTEDKEILTMADVRREATTLFDDSWVDTLVTIGVIFGVLVSSSVALGLVARQASVITQHVTHQATQKMLNNASTPTSWRF